MIYNKAIVQILLWIFMDLLSIQYFYSILVIIQQYIRDHAYTLASTFSSTFSSFF